jgi:hypothetical protein
MATKQKGMLAKVGNQKKFFAENRMRHLETMNEWIIDQLTVQLAYGSAKVEVFEASQTPFRDDLEVGSLLQQF